MIESGQSQLPIAYGTFIGRENELGQILELLRKKRLVVLTGPGGCGKTRLALEAALRLASEFEDGTCWCDLAPLSDPDYLAQKVAALLGGSERPSASSFESVISIIRDRRLLLVLDNCEHLLEACAALASTILKSCPRTVLLATSLQPLGIREQVVWHAPPLSLVYTTSGSADPGASDSVRLFVARAAEVFPGFSLTAQNSPVIASICRRLDGLPLAIELAAARVRLLTVEQIEKRLDSAFALLSGGRLAALPRHQTLKAMMDWTYQFLSEREQRLLHRLSVFAGPFTLEMVETVCADLKERAPNVDLHPVAPTGRNDGESPVLISPPQVLELLTGLVDKSFLLLLPREEHTGAGYRLLEVVRQYAREKLEESGEASGCRDNYLDWCSEWAKQAEPHLMRFEQVVWLKEFERHQEHFRAALRWACTTQQVEKGLQLAITLTRYWLTGEMKEGRGWLEELLSLEADQRKSESSRVFPGTRAWGLCMSGRLAVRQGDDDHGKRRGEESLSLFRALDDKPGLITALNLLALAAQDTGDYDKALAYYQEALELSRLTDNTRMTAVLLTNQGLMYYEQQEYRQAARLWEEGTVLGERLGLNTSLDNLGCLAMMQGDLSRAADLLDKDLKNAVETGDKHSVALTSMDRGEVARRMGELGRAQALLSNALIRHEQMNNDLRTGENLVYLAHAARNEGQYSEARRRYEFSLSLLVKTNYTRFISHAKTGLGVLDLAEGRYERALSQFVQGLRVARDGRHRLCAVEALEGIAGVCAAQGHTREAMRLIVAAAAERERICAPVPPVERERYEELVGAASSAVSPNTLMEIRSEVVNFSLDQVVEQELGGTSQLSLVPGAAKLSPLSPSAVEHELQIYTFGNSRVVLGGRMLTSSDWKYVKAKELFYYLLFEGPAAKSQIGAALWPDASPRQLRGAFHQAMHHARLALGDRNWILYSEGTYAFNHTRSSWCDANELEEHLQRAREFGRPDAVSPSHRARAISHLEAAAVLVRGDFLEDLDAGEWAIVRREGLRQLFLNALIDLGQMQVADARYSEAIATFQRALGVDSYLEGAHRGLMRALARQGNSAQALRHFNYLRRMMSEELGGNPSPETMFLYQRLKRGDDV